MRNSRYLVGLVLLTFFVISFLTNILGPIIPDLIKDFELSLGLAGFLPFAFFVAYGVMSLPAGVLVERRGEKWAMVFAFSLAALGALLFAVFPTFPTAMMSLFVIGSGMAILQVAINPLLRVAGGEKHFAFNSVLGQLFFGLASFVSPLVYSYLVSNMHNPTKGVILKAFASVTPPDLSWVSLYWIFGLTSLLMVVIIVLSGFPKVELKDDEKTGSVSIYRELISNKAVIIYFFGIFFYVGSEQGIANWMSQFLATYHQFDPQSEGAGAVSLFWGLMTAGAFLGLVLLKVMDSRLVLKLFSISSMVALGLALFGPANVSYYSFVTIGFTISVMWSIVISLALNSMDQNHGAFSGILVTGIVGGAIVPLIVGWLGEGFGLRIGMTFIFLTLAYVLWIGFWARPLVRNETIFNKAKARV